MSWTFWPLINKLVHCSVSKRIIQYVLNFSNCYSIRIICTMYLYIYSKILLATSIDDALLFIRNRHNYFFYFVLWDDTDSDTLIEKISSQVIIYCLSNKLWLMNIRGSSFIIHICRRFVFLSNVCVYQYRIFIKKWECPNIIKTIIIYS